MPDITLRSDKGYTTPLQGTAGTTITKTLALADPGGKGALADARLYAFNRTTGRIVVDGEVMAITGAAARECTLSLAEDDLLDPGVYEVYVRTIESDASRLRYPGQGFLLFNINGEARRYERATLLAAQEAAEAAKVAAAQSEQNAAASEESAAESEARAAAYAALAEAIVGSEAGIPLGEKGLPGGVGTLDASGLPQQGVSAANVADPRHGFALDGVTDDSAKLQALVDTYAHVIVPEHVTVGLASPVNVPSGRKLMVGGTLKWVGATPAAKTGFFRADGVENVLVWGGRYEAPNAWVAVIYASAAKNISLSDFTCEKAGAVICEPTSGGYAGADLDPESPTFNAVYNLKVQHGTLANADHDGPAIAAVHLAYVNGAKISDLDIYDYAHGIQWWGGNANHLFDGPLANERKCRDIQISNVRVRTAQAGIWGSMGRRVSVVNCHVSDCADVGFDAEGSFDTTFMGGSASDCANGCLTTFFYNQGVKFVGVSVRQSDPAHPLFRIYNQAQNTENLDVTVEGCSFICENGIGVVDSSFGPVRRLTFRNNTLTDVKISFAAENQKWVEVLGNTLEFKTAAPAAFSGIHAGPTHGGHAIVRGNTVISSVVQPAGSVGVSVSQFDFNSGPRNEVDDNTITGFGTDIKLRWVGGNAGFVSRSFVRRNVLGAGVVEREEAGAAKSLVLFDDNRLSTTAEWPSAIPTTGYWNRAQRIFYQTPSAAGKVGAVCVAAGEPGTWKDFGVINA